MLVRSPFSTVLLPARDAAETVVDAARGALAERSVGELVAIDDGSVDGTAARLDALARVDPRVRVLRTTGVGVARALALGLAAARGDRIARMDADDVSLPGRIDRSVARLDADPSLGAVATRVRAEGAGPGLERYVAWQNALVSPADHARERFVEATLCHPATTLDRRALEAVGGWRAFDGPEDWDLWLRLEAAGFGLAKVPEALLVWRHRDARVTFRDPRCSPAARNALRARYLAPALPRPFWIWGAGKTGRRLGRALEAEGARASGFVDVDPRRIGGVARCSPIVGADAVLASPPGFLLVAVGDPDDGGRPAREIVRERLVAAGLREGDDFLCAS